MVWRGGAPQSILTIPSQYHGGGRAEGSAVGHHVPDYTGVVTRIRCLHLGNVQVSRLLGDKASIVLLNKVWVLIEDPCISKV